MTSGRRKILILVGSFLGLVLLAAGIFWYRWRHTSIKNPSLLPAQCDFICAVNSHLIIEKILTHRHFLAGDSGTLRRIGKEAGIDFTEPFVVAGSWKEKSVTAIFSVNDSVKLKQFIRSFEETQSADSRASSGGKGRVHFVLRNDRCYVHLGNKPELVSAESTPLYTKNKAYLESGFDMEWFKGVMDNGRMGEPFSWIKAKEYLSFALIIPKENEHLAVIEIDHADSIHSSGCFTGDIVSASIPADWWQNSRWMQKEAKRLLAINGIDTVHLFKGNGPLWFRYAGETTAQKSVITYEFDDEFNRVAKTKILSENIPALELGMPVNSSDAWKKMKYDSLYYGSQTDTKCSHIFGYKLYIRDVQPNLLFSTFMPKDKSVDTIDRQMVFSCNFTKLKNKPLPMMGVFFAPDNMSMADLRIDAHKLLFRLHFAPSDVSASGELIKAIFQTYNHFSHAR